MMLLRAIMELARPRLVCCSIPLALPFGVVLLAAAVSKAAAQQTPAAPPQRQEADEMVTTHADSTEMIKDTTRLRGHVEITYQDMKLTADEVTYAANSADVEARGHVLFVDPESHLAADELHYNLRTKKGWFANTQGFVHGRVHPRARMLTTENPFYVQAARVERLDEDTYSVERGHLTTCECEEKGWSISARRAKVEVDNRLVTHDASFRMFDVPFFYSPMLVNSIAHNPRQTGFLLPHIGNSSVKGFIVGDGFFWAINPSVNLLLGLENYSIRGLAPRAEFSAKPSETSDLTVDYFNVRDRGSGFDRLDKVPGQSLHATGKADDLGYGFRGVVGVDYVTSLAFRETWTDNFTDAVSSEAHQVGFLTKNFDAYSLNIYVTQYQDFLSATPETLQLGKCAAGSGSIFVLSGCVVSLYQAPTISFDGEEKQLGQTPLYFSFDTSAGGVGRTQPGLQFPDLSERLDFHPQFTLRFKPFWGFHLTPSLGVQSTLYGASLSYQQGVPQASGSLDRLLGEFSLDLRPPSFEKVFAGTYRKRRFKHVIEPEVQYRLVRVRDASEVFDVVRYDDLDVLAQTNEIEYSLTNTLYTRQDAPEGSTDVPQARELLSLRLSQKYYFDPTFGGALQPGGSNVWEPTIDLTGFAFARGQHLSPVVSVLKFEPFSNYDTELRADIAPQGGGILNAGITSHIHRGPLGLAFTDFFINRTETLSTPITPVNPLALPSFHLFRTVASYGDVNRKGFSGAVGLDYNFAQKVANQIVGQLGYNFGCFGLDVEFRRFDLGPLRRENQYRVALSLANVGTFGNLKRRERLY
jgi:LPS-assembly protein